jgi:nitroimidazol reductase NimA-like FMN-containing flavoprotein (pyridoxamine 5'-phosphate oxidase superfamily)
MARLRELNFEDCVRLLRASAVGRAAVMTPQGPQIIPLNYTVADDAVIVATSPYGALGTYGPGGLVAFEVDDVDAGTRTGWSVVLRGRAAALDGRAAVRWCERADVPRPWADGSRNLFLRIPWTELSGRTLSEKVADAGRVRAQRLAV